MESRVQAVLCLFRQASLSLGASADPLQEKNTIYHFIHRLGKPLRSECNDAGQSALSWSCCTINSVGNEILDLSLVLK